MHDIQNQQAIIFTLIQSKWRAPVLWVPQDDCSKGRLWNIFQKPYFLSGKVYLNVTSNNSENSKIFWNFLSKGNCIVLIWDVPSIYLIKFNNGNTRAMCKICSKLTIETPKRRQWSRSCVVVANFEQISHILVSPLLILNKYMPVVIFNFEQAFD